MIPPNRIEIELSSLQIPMCEFKCDTIVHIDARKCETKEDLGVLERAASSFSLGLTLYNSTLDHELSDEMCAKVLQLNVKSDSSMISSTRSKPLDPHKGLRYSLDLRPFRRLQKLSVAFPVGQWLLPPDGLQLRSLNMCARCLVCQFESWC